jgi:hypothetical protein
LFFRADHFALARQAVPVLLIMGIAGGADLIDGGRAAGDQWISDYTSNCYHQHAMLGVPVGIYAVQLRILNCFIQYYET